MTLNLEALTAFVVKAKKTAYAGDGAEVPADKIQTPGFKELSFTEGKWEYRDSYAGYFLAPGREVVWFQGVPVWMMAYAGGMTSNHRKDQSFAKQTFTFLKQALSQVSINRPFRGPLHFVDGDYSYSDIFSGTMTEFTGREHILYQGNKVFQQRYIGGLILPKDLAQSL